MKKPTENHSDQGEAAVDVLRRLLLLHRLGGLEAVHARHLDIQQHDVDVLALVERIIDPGVHVLAETLYVYEGQSVPMPIAWTKRWGAGRVFYGALGHDPQEFQACPAAFDLNLRGLRWAAGDLN